MAGDAAADGYVKAALESQFRRQQEERRETLLTFASYLSMPEVQKRVMDEPAHFVELIEVAVRDYGVQQTMISNKLSITSAAVSRWMSNQSLPVPYGRPHILSVIAEIIRETDAHQGQVLKGTVSAV